MKQIVTLILIFTTLCVSSAQQGDKEKREERLKALKVSYFTEKLELTESEAQKFWPVYNAHENKLRKLRSDLRASRRQNPQGDDRSKQMVSIYISYEEQKLSLLKTLVSDMENVISSNKILRLIRAEEGFRRELIEQFRSRRESQNDKKNKP